MRKIAFLMPSAATGKLSGELARREKILKELVSPGTQIDIFGLEKDPEKSHLGTIQSSYDSAMSVPADIECALAAEKAGYQAVIVACAGDPGVVPLREVLKIPVIPPGSSAKHICSTLGRFSVLSTGRGEPRQLDILQRGTLMNEISVHPIGLSVPEVRVKPDEAYAGMVREGLRAVKEFRAASVTFGCMSMAFLMNDEKLSTEIGIPAINPVKTAVKMAEMYLDMGITHSKTIYRYPASMRSA